MFTPASRHFDPMLNHGNMAAGRHTASSYSNPRETWHLWRVATKSLPLLFLSNRLRHAESSLALVAP